MSYERKSINIIFSGGGVKGIAYAGVFDIAEKKEYRYVNLAGVSAGSIASAFAGAGYTSAGIINAINRFSFEKIDVNEIPKKVPVVKRYAEFVSQMQEARISIDEATKAFFYQCPFEGRVERAVIPDLLSYRCNVLKNIVTFCKEGCLFDGDYLENWVSDVLEARGIRTFGDLRDGKADKVNPRGYRVRMTAVDANRGKIIVLPDDVEYYGIDPDKFEVAKAVRMSTSVPFAFKPVELKHAEGKTISTHYILDGGVFDNFPVWLISKDENIPNAGFRLVDRSKSKLFSLSTPLNIIKTLISTVHDIGVPNEKYDTEFITEINTTNISSLDFNLSPIEKAYLIKAGKNAAIRLFDYIEQANMGR